ncbi:MAG TPA: hypothetical protein VFB13_17705 [Reyranella sp.]|nr:hypothetical protein [Reyranella sp.]
MSLTDARAADEALHLAPRRKPGRGAIAAGRARVRELTLRRMTDAVRQLMSMNGNVTRADLERQGFSDGEIDRHFRQATRAAGAAEFIA